MHLVWSRGAVSCLVPGGYLADTPRDQPPLPRTRHPPRSDPPQTRHPLGPDPPRTRHPPDQTPPSIRHPPRSDTPLGPDTPPMTRHPPVPDTPLDQTPPQDQTPPWTRHPPGTRHPSRAADSEIRSTSGRYASYWNAFLLNHDVGWKHFNFVVFNFIQNKIVQVYMSI